MQRFLVTSSVKTMVLLSTFLVGVAISSISDSPGVPYNHADYSSLPVVSYCDLMAAPGIYENKLVRLRLEQRMGIGQLQRDDICTKGDSDFHLDIVAGPNYIGTREGMNTWNTEPVDHVILLVGRFRKDPARTSSSSHNYQLELLRIETITTPALTLSLGMSRDAAEALIKECGGHDVTRYQEIMGPNGESPLPGLVWDLGPYDSVLEIGSADGKVTQLIYWTGADFSVSKLHREESKKYLKSLTFDPQSKTVKIVQ